MITIQDNNYQGKVCSLHDTTDLLSIGNKPIRQLCDENEHLLVFPLSIDDTDDRIGDSTIVDIYAEDGNSVRIKSGNIMGFVGRNVGERFRFKTIHSDNITLGNHIIICDPPPVCHYLRTDK